MKKQKDYEWYNKIQKLRWQLEHPKKGEKIDELKKRLVTIIDGDVTWQKYWEWRENKIRADERNKTIEEIEKIIKCAPHLDSISQEWLTKKIKENLKKEKQ